MNLIWHLARKDLRRLLIPAAIFFVLLVGKLLLGIQVLDVVDHHQFAALRDYLKAVLMAEFVFGYALVAAIVHEDPLAGSRAFWMTRPISGLQLLGAKALVLFLMVVLLPVVVTLPWWLACNLNAKAMLVAATGTVFIQGLIVLAGLPFAVLTSNLARYVACTIGAIATLVVAKLLLQRAGWVNAFMPPETMETRSATIAIILCATALALVVHQFRTRRTVRSFAIGATGLSLGFVASMVWPAGWTLPRKSTLAGIDSATLRVEIEAADLRTQRQARMGNHMTVRGRVFGLPENCIPEGFTGRQTWTWPDGTPTTLPIDKPTSAAAYQSSVRKYLGLPVVASPLSALRNFEEIDDDGTRLFAFSAAWPPSALQRAKIRPASLSLDVQTRLLQPELIGEANLAVGASVASSGRALRVLQITDPSTDRTEISLIEITPAGRARRLRSHQLFLVGHFAGVLSGFHEHRSEHLIVGGVSVSARTLVVHSSQLPDTVTPFAHHRDSFRLAWIDYKPLGSVHLSTRRSDLTIAVD